MAQLLKVATIVIGFWFGVVVQAPNERFLQELYERHSWFDLRDAVAGKAVPALYSGAVASAFNRTGDAESYLNRAIREAATTEAANDAREALINLYMRLGRSSDMIRVLDERLRQRRRELISATSKGSSSRSAVSESDRTNGPARTLPVRCGDRRRLSASHCQ
jgi:hypothetical protein